MTLDKCKTRLNVMVEKQKGAPPGPKRYGRVERALKLHAELNNMTAEQFLRDLLAKGANQTQVAELLECSRQAVGYAAMRHGIEFPGIKFDLDAAAQREDRSCKTFDQFLQKYWRDGDLTQSKIAAKFGLSLSTVRRRVKQLYEKQQGVVRPQPDRTLPRNRRSKKAEDKF